VSERSKYITIMLVPDGTEARLAWRMRQWQLYTVLGLLIVLVLGMVAFFAFYGKVVSRAAMTEQVMQENQALQRYRYKVQLLEENLNQARDFVSRMATMAGIDVQFPEIPPDSALMASFDDERGSTMPRSVADDFSIPSGMPVVGFITQDFEVEDSEHFHPGIDIACAVGTPVLATGSGTVLYTGYDSTYGNIVVVEHNDSVTTVYGHNDSVLVQQGQPILAGSRIALSGNTGKSTAPHVHYELRIHDQPINPLDSPYDEETRQH
jgi:murein DD-endopeptidase MepM/ murein hydrolase activator NlpD